MNPQRAQPSYNQWLKESTATSQKLTTTYLQRFKDASAQSTVPAPNKALSRLHSLALRRIINALTAKKRGPSLTTPCNRFTLKLADRIENLIRTVLQVNRDGIVVKCRHMEARKRLAEIEPDLPEKDYPRFLKLLREARDSPISVDHPMSSAERSIWNHILTELTLILDPTLKQFPELEKVRLAKGPRFIMNEESKFRSGLLKYFAKALKNLG